MPLGAQLNMSRDRKGRVSGHYECSVCGAPFRPNPKIWGEMATLFAVHVGTLHSPGKDVSQSARIIRKATENH